MPLDRDSGVREMIRKLRNQLKLGRDRALLCVVLSFGPMLSLVLGAFGLRAAIPLSIEAVPDHLFKVNVAVCRRTGIG